MTHVYELDGNQMQNSAQAHAYLKENLNLPDYYGMNADALFDCLTEDSREVLIWLNSSDKIDKKILKVFEEASQENPFITIVEIEDDE
ncbi:MAG: ribonuclease inhibitor [Ruminococcus sp.]|nr:ribonuclease inhibitor [Ruminococcus sp.]